MAYILRISALRFRAPWLRTDVRALRGTQRALNCSHLYRFRNAIYTSLGYDLVNNEQPSKIEKHDPTERWRAPWLRTDVRANKKSSTTKIK